MNKFITNIDEILELKYQDRIFFKCFKCGKDSSVLLRSKIKQMNTYKKFGGLICVDCKFQLVYPRDKSAKKHKAWHASLTDKEKKEHFDKMVETKRNWSEERKKEHSKTMSDANNRLTEKQKALKLERFRKTNKERYGTNGPRYTTNSEKFKNRLQEIYGKGVDHVNKIPGMNDRIVKSISKNLGYSDVPEGINGISQFKEVKQKIENTNLEKYGVKYPFQSDKMQKKGEDTKEKKYGDRNYTNRDKADKTFRKNHDNMSFAEYGGSEECQKKISNTMNERYGVPYIHMSDKYKELMLNKYGDISFFKSNYFINMMLEKYGTLHPTYKYNYYGIYFDSSWELSIWIYCIDNNISIIRNPCRFEYIYNNEVHIYEPDFMINGLLVEIKGDQYFKEDGSMCFPYTKLHHNSKPLTSNEKDYYNGLYEAKHQCGISNGVVFWKSSECKKYLDYCNNKYPNWDNIYRKDNPYNPSYLNYIYIFQNTGISPYDMCKNAEYTIVKNKGIDPFDISLKRG